MRNRWCLILIAGLMLTACGTSSTNEPATQVAENAITPTLHEAVATDTPELDPTATSEPDEPPAPTLPANVVEQFSWVGGGGGVLPEVGRVDGFPIELYSTEGDSSEFSEYSPYLDASPLSPFHGTTLTFRGFGTPIDVTVVGPNGETTTAHLDFTQSILGSYETFFSPDMALGAYTFTFEGQDSYFVQEVRLRKALYPIIRTFCNGDGGGVFWLTGFAPDEVVHLTVYRLNLEENDTGFHSQLSVTVDANGAAYGEIVDLIAATVMATGSIAPIPIFEADGSGPYMLISAWDKYNCADQ